MCDHRTFEAIVNVVRLTDGDDGPLKGFTTEIRVSCSDCRMPFEFVGIAGGFHPAEPRVSADGIELRAPIKPSSAVEEMGGVQ